MSNPSRRAVLETVLEENIRAIDIPPRPLILECIDAEMNRDNPCFRRVGQLINADVGLAAGLITTANSPYFGMCGRVRSVGEALLLLGLDVASRAVAAISLRRAFPGSGQYVRFWDSSARIAALSGWLTQEIGVPDLLAADAYTFGLFRDCGIVVLLRRFPAYLQTLAAANEDGEHDFTAVERADFPTDHTVVGSLLARNWWLPEEICQAIRHHHEQPAIDLAEAGLPLASRRLIAVSQSAEHLLQSVTGSSRTQEWTKLGGACRRLLGVDEVALLELQAGAAVVLDAIV